MTEPVSVAASVAGLISLGIQVTQSLVDFYNACKHRDSDLVHMTERLDGLRDIFQCLTKTLSDRDFQADERGLIESIETSIKNCDEGIQELQDECQKFSKTSSQGVKAAVGVAGRRVEQVEMVIILSWTRRLRNVKSIESEMEYSMMSNFLT